MAKQHRDLFAGLELIGINRYQITENDIQTIDKYLKIIQAGWAGGLTWQDLIRYPGPYGTSIVIHEIVEIRLLRSRGLKPLKLRSRPLRQLLAKNIDAHVMATYEEHLYLQEVIQRRFRQTFQVATLIQANRNDNVDLQLLLESDIGVYILEEKRVKDVRRVIQTLKSVRII